MDAGLLPEFLEIERRSYRARLASMGDAALRRESEHRTLSALNHPDPSGAPWRWEMCRRECASRPGALFDEALTSVIRGG